MTTFSTGFLLAGFGRAVHRGDVDSQLACYRPDAEVRAVYLPGTRRSVQVLNGLSAITAWLGRVHVDELPHRLVKLVDGGDRLTFIEEFVRPDGTVSLVTSTAELSGGSIGQQHSILGWDSSLDARSQPLPDHGSTPRPTRPSKDSP